jgi:hypothetical protein
MTSQLSAPYQALLNQLILMDHETGKANSPPKLISLERYFNWKGRFESYCRLMDVRMWFCITDGYQRPTFSDTQKNDKGEDVGPSVIKEYTFEQMSPEAKKDYEAESKALGSLRMALQGDFLHLFEHYTTSKSLWDALKEHCEGDEEFRKRRKDLLKRQYYVFNGLKEETLDETLMRYSHLLVELAYFGYRPDQEEVIEKLLEALPDKWENYVTSIQQNSDFRNWNLDQVIRKLRAQDMKKKTKATGSADFIQKPEMYHGRSIVPSSKGSTNSGITAFYSGENEGSSVMDSDQKMNFMSSPESAMVVHGGSQLVSTHGNPINSMSMSIPSAQGQVGMLATFVAAHENWLGRRVSDPELVREDYRQLDPDDIEEMDLNWQLAMLTLRVQRFTERTGRKMVDGKLGFDKTKVKCYNCDGFGHFARECQRPKRDNNSATARQNYNQSGSISNQNSARLQNSDNRSSGMVDNSRALVVQQDGTYNWGAVSAESKDLAYFAEINNDVSIAEEYVDNSFDYMLYSSTNDDIVMPARNDYEEEERQMNQCRSESSKSSESDSEKADVDNKKAEIEENVEVKVPENLSTEELVNYMAKLEAPEQKVQISLHSIISVCQQVHRFSSEINDLNKLVESKTDLVNAASDDRSKLKTEVAVLKGHVKEYLHRIKNEEDRFDSLRIEFKQLITKKQMMDDAHENKVKECAEVEKKLANAKVEIVELTGKLNKMRDIRTMMNHLTDAKTKGAQPSFVKNYHEVSPPFADNYESFPKIDRSEEVRSNESKGETENLSKISPVSETLPETQVSEGVSILKQEPKSMDNKSKHVSKESEQKTVVVRHFTLKNCNREFSEKEYLLDDIDPKLIDKVWNVVESNVVIKEPKSVVIRTPFPKNPKKKVENVKFEKGFTQTSTMDAEGKSVQSESPEKFAERKLKEMLFIDQEVHETTIPKEGVYKVKSVHTIEEARKRLTDIEVMEEHGIPVKFDSASDKPKKAFPKRSCFTCHEKGHVASCCPFKKNLNRVSPVKSRGSNDESSSSKVNNAQFIPRSVQMRPRSISPRGSSSGSNNLRQSSPYKVKSDSAYYDRITGKVQTNPRPLYQQHSPRRVHSTPERVPRAHSSSVESNQRRPSVIRGPSTSPNRRPSGNQSVTPSKARLPRDGYWTEIKGKDENGRPKTMKAWVPYDN